MCDLRRTPKKILSVLLSVVMVLSVFGGMTFTASAETYGGSCQASGSVQWQVDSQTGVLAITGTGTMKDYTSCPSCVARL